MPTTKSVQNQTEHLLSVTVSSPYVTIGTDSTANGVSKLESSETFEIADSFLDECKIMLRIFLPICIAALAEDAPQVISAAQFYRATFTDLQTVSSLICWRFCPVTRINTSEKSGRILQGTRIKFRTAYKAHIPDAKSRNPVGTRSSISCNALTSSPTYTLLGMCVYFICVSEFDSPPRTNPVRLLGEVCECLLACSLK